MNISTFTPDATPSTYTITFCETLSPYARWFYENTSQPGETMEAFLSRILTERGKQYLTQLAQKQMMDKIVADMEGQLASTVTAIDGLG